MSISSFRSILYGTAKFLGDVSAVSKAAKTGSMKPIYKRGEHRILGRMAGKILGRLTR